MAYSASVIEQALGQSFDAEAIEGLVVPAADRLSDVSGRIGPASSA
jgi:hypothetical protein